MFSIKSLLSGFRTVLMGPCLDQLVIDLTAISTRGIIHCPLQPKLELACTFHISTVLTALSTVFFNFVRKIISYDLILTSTDFTINNSLWNIKMTIGLLFQSLIFYDTYGGITTNDKIVQSFVRMSKNCFSCWLLLLRVKTIFCVFN